MTTSVDDKMKMLERRANVVRSRLLRAVDALDNRRHQVVELGHTARQMAIPAAISVVGVAIALGLGALGVGLVIGASRRRSLGYRVKHALQGLELVPQPPSLARRLFDKTALTLVSIAASEVGRRTLHNFVDGRMPGGRPIEVREATR